MAEWRWRVDSLLEELAAAGVIRLSPFRLAEITDGDPDEVADYLLAWFSGQGACAVGGTLLGRPLRVRHRRSRRIAELTHRMSRVCGTRKRGCDFRTR